MLHDGVQLPGVGPALEEQVWVAAQRYGGVKRVRFNISREPPICYLDMDRYAEAAAFVAAGTFNLDGISVTPAPRPPGPRRGLYIGGFADDVVDADLFELCRPYGRISSISIHRQDDWPAHAFVGYHHVESVERAVAALDGQDLHGQTLRVAPVQHGREGS